MPTRYADPEPQAPQLQVDDTNIFRDVWGAIKDPFTADTANAGTYDVTDYAYGGSLAAQQAQQAALAEAGNSGYRTLAEAGNQDYNKLQNAALGIYDAADLARGSAMQSANVTGQYAADYGARADRLKQFGDQAALRDWQTSAGKLQGYAPSAETQGAGYRLANFDAGNVGREQIDTYQALRDYADQGPGPSAAEAQLKQAQDANVAQAVALARSGRGSGANANAERQAQFQAADIGQRTAAELANLRANEAATWRGQQMQALSGAGSLASSAEQARQGATGQQLQALQATGQFTQGNEANRLAALQSAANQYGQQYGAISGNQIATDQARQGYLGQSLQAQGLSAQQASGAYDQYLGALTSGAGIQNQAGQNRVNAYQAGLGQQAAYQQAALGVGENEATRRAQLANTKLGADTQASMANQNADLQKDSSIAGMASAALGALALSDRREKTSIRRYLMTGGK